MITKILYLTWWQGTMSVVFTNEIKNLGERNVHEKNRSKAFEILLKCEKSVKEIKKFFPKKINKNITEDQRSILLKNNDAIWYQKCNC